MKGKFPWRKLLFLPFWLILLLSGISAAALVTVFTRGWETSAFAYAAYVISFYTLSVFTLWFLRVFPHWRKEVKQKITNHPYANRYLNDVYFKTKVSLYFSLGANLLYAALNGISFYFSRSAWFAILAGYYTTLAIMRFLLVRYSEKTGMGINLKQELKRSRLCGGILLTLNLAISGAVLMILYQNRGYEYPGILIYVMAAYTFYVTTHAIVNLIKARKYESPVMSTARGINLSAALVSMLALETAMLSEFGGDLSTKSRWLFIALTGGAVALTIVAISGFIIFKSTKGLQNLKEH